jgi:cell division septation protein DedD
MTRKRRTKDLARTENHDVSPAAPFHAVPDRHRALISQPPAATAKAFSWYVDRSGELVTLSADKPSPSSPVTTPPEPVTTGTSAAPSAPPEPTMETTPTASTLGLLAGILIGGSGYAFGRRRHRRCKQSQSAQRSD